MKSQMFYKNWLFLYNRGSIKYNKQLQPGCKKKHIETFQSRTKVFSILECCKSCEMRSIATMLTNYDT